ncbi:hypothetical protein C8A00DRAFT_17109 [Chaetomidium leptoderma]|uniref:Uncharacterized protein n=1 Tax=Chaetomidium leptoderma TaxID=669021 RepID=A0AAN6ZTM7_9PEZI|nr:hypothetical protein C8A00DRAFT_17109 [Chaetomidium leptoderma]
MDSFREQQHPGISGSTSANTPNPPSLSGHAARRRKNHRGGKKKKSRRKSFAMSPDEIAQDSVNSEGLDEVPQGFYTRPGRNLSSTSIESEALLDHRVDSDEEDEGAPLLSSSVFQRSETIAGYGSGDSPRRNGPTSRRNSSRASSLRKRALADTYNVNYPPSVPGSPALHSSDHMTLSFGDVLLRDELDHGQHSHGESGDEGDARPSPLERRKTIALQAQEDVCFPQEGLSDIGDDEHAARDSAHRLRPRRRRGKWPDLSILDEWSRFEKEGRSEERRVKRITEPQLINGRLRPVHRNWFQAEEEAPYRFTYFNEEFRSTIHSQTISELVQPEGTFKELFVPDPPVLTDSSDSEEEEQAPNTDLFRVLGGQGGDPRIPSRQPSLATTNQDFAERKHSTNSEETKAGSGDHSPKSPPSKSSQNGKPPKAPKYGDRPVWWLDIMSPSEAEMKVISKAFGIHPLTAEDIMMQEQREKVELFRNYYFVNYRSFDQDHASENFLEPVNMYVVVFREGVLSFHFSVTPHPANVRRRIRQLRDYLILSSDWISYAIIDDITDVFVPLIQNIEDEVDDIDYAILQMHSEEDQATKEEKRRMNEKSDLAEVKSAEAGRDMLRRVGDCRKKVMSLYRLLSNKADVIKGFAKRCNEHWEVAPRSEIGLYLGDIQDHIVTMTSNLTHYEKILSRSHGNYLAQINIRMNERQEQTADVLGKLTVLGTIVLPMNIITGLWGMNVWVPGQEYEGDLKWFMVITAGLLLFGLGCYWTAKRVYKIV